MSSVVSSGKISVIVSSVTPMFVRYSRRVSFWGDVVASFGMSLPWRSVGSSSLLVGVSPVLSSIVFRNVFRKRVFSTDWRSRTVARSASGVSSVTGTRVGLGESVGVAVDDGSDIVLDDVWYDVWYDVGYSDWFTGVFDLKACLCAFGFVKRY